MRFPGNVRLAIAVLCLLFKKTLLIAGPLLCMVLVLTLSIQAPDLLTETSPLQALLLAGCLVYAMVQTWFWTRLVISRVFGPPDGGNYLARDASTERFFLFYQSPIQPTGTYARPIILESDANPTLVLLPTRILRHFATLYALLIPYAFFLLLSNNTSHDALDFVFPLLNAAIALFVAYALYTLLSRWYWDVRRLEPAALHELYRTRIPVNGVRLSHSLRQFLLQQTKSGLLIVLFGMPMVFVIYSLLRPGHLAYWIGMEGLIFLALGSIIAVSALVALILIYYGLPPTAAALSWLAFVSMAAPEDHRVQAVPLLANPSAAKNSIEQEFCSWLSHNGIAAKWAPDAKSPCVLTGTPSKELPIVFVSASGGGLRASYWTASILAALSDCVDGFDSKVFSISAVSGSSLGAAIHGLGTQLVPNHTRACELRRAGSDENTKAGLSPSVRRFVSDVLAADFLAPTAERLLFGDLFRTAVPFHVILPARMPDRGDALRDSWYAAIHASCKRLDIDCTRGKAFEEPLLQWRSNSRWTPVTVFNATHLETGARLISSTSAIATDALDFHDVARADTPLGEAVLNSARFPVVSPAGRLQDRASQGAPRGHVVDGSYFDNTGARTTLEIARAVFEIARHLNIKLSPTFINLENDPGFWEAMRLSRTVAERYFNGNGEITQVDAFQVMLKEAITDTDRREGGKSDDRGRFHLALSGTGVLHELLVAGMGVMNVWSYHRASVHRDFQTFYRAGLRKVDLRLCPGAEHSPTLGWKLGKENKASIDQAILTKPGIKASPDVIKFLFSYEISKAQEQENEQHIEYLRTQGGPGRDEARRLSEQYDRISRSYAALPDAYREMFGKHAYGEGFGRSDMLGRALTFNICHNAIHDGIQKVRDALMPAP